MEELRQSREEVKVFCREIDEQGAGAGGSVELLTERDQARARTALVERERDDAIAEVVEARRACDAAVELRTQVEAEV